MGAYYVCMWCMFVMYVRYVLVCSIHVVQLRMRARSVCQFMYVGSVVCYFLHGVMQVMYLCYICMCVVCGYCVTCVCMCARVIVHVMNVCVCVSVLGYVMYVMYGARVVYDMYVMSVCYECVM